ncbi:MAG TPA: hypothetical protein VMQ45_00420 [Burkholderiaceae bacterium]|nr:hypothetical protein [Burkholderiaceae bacterium]
MLKPVSFWSSLFSLHIGVSRRKSTRAAMGFQTTIGIEKDEAIFFKAILCLKVSLFAARDADFFPTLGARPAGRRIARASL